MCGGQPACCRSLRISGRYVAAAHFPARCLAARLQDLPELDKSDADFYRDWGISREREVLGLRTAGAAGMQRRQLCPACWQQAVGTLYKLSLVCLGHCSEAAASTVHVLALLLHSLAVLPLPALQEILLVEFRKQLEEATGGPLKPIFGASLPFAPAPSTAVQSGSYDVHSVFLCPGGLVQHAGQQRACQEGHALSSH